MPSYRPGLPSLPPVVKTLIIVNVVVFCGQLAMPQLTEWGALHYWKSPLFKPHQIITHMFMHDPEPSHNFLHIIFNMLVLWMFGSTLEQYWGPKRFINIYLICGIGAAITQMVMIPFEAKQALNQALAVSPGASADDISAFLQEFTDHYSMIGASGAIMGLMAAFAWLFPNTEFYVFLIPIPIKAKYLIPVYVLYDLFGGFERHAGDNVGHFAHLGGALVGLLIVIFQNRRDRRNFY